MLPQNQDKSESATRIVYFVLIFAVLISIFIPWYVAKKQKEILRDCDSTMAYITFRGSHKGSYVNYIYVVDGKEFEGSYRGSVEGDSIRVYYSKQNPWTNTAINDSSFFQWGARPYSH